MIKNPPANAGGTRDVGSVPGLGRSPGGGHGNPLRYSCLENPMDTGAWWATVHRAEKSRTQMKRFSMHSMYKFCQEKCLLTAPGPLLKEINWIYSNILKMISWASHFCSLEFDLVHEPTLMSGPLRPQASHPSHLQGWHKAFKSETGLTFSAVVLKVGCHSGKSPCLPDSVFLVHSVQFSSVQFSHSVVFDSLRPCGL